MFMTQAEAERDALLIENAELVVENRALRAQRAARHRSRVALYQWGAGGWQRVNELAAQIERLEQRPKHAGGPKKKDPAKLEPRQKRNIAAAKKKAAAAKAAAEAYAARFKDTVASRLKFELVFVDVADPAQADVSEADLQRVRELAAQIRARKKRQ